MTDSRGSEHHPELDWADVVGSAEFQELVSRRRRFVVPATIFFLAWYFGFILLAGYAPDFMGEEFLTDGLTVGYVLALTQFVMVWGLGWMYLRKADRELDPLARKATERALQGDGRASGHFEPPPEGGEPARSHEEVGPR